MDNGCNTQIFQILFKEHDGKFNLSGNIIRIIPNTVELSHKWVLENLKYQEP